MRRAAIALWWLAGAGLASAADPATGRLLVAARDLRDPNFAQTVVVLIRYDATGAAGLIVNRETDIPAARALRGQPGTKEWNDPVFLGGPVSPRGVMALMRAAKRPPGASLVSGDVYVLGSQKTLQDALATKPDPSRLRIYLGYAGWAAGQLEREIEVGGWHVLIEPADTIFTTDPGSLWTRLIAKTEMRIARMGRAAALERR
jgi:putative transcriptional regulator